jgi:O-antigen/teichoic acid export membrane protein
MGARERKGIAAARMKKTSRGEGLLQSGIIFAAISFLPGLGNYAFQGVISRNLGNTGEFGLANSALSFTALLSLPVTIVTFAVTHYIARFNFAGDDERLHSLLAGCRKFLFRLTVAGSVLAVLLVKPLSEFFHFARASLMLAALTFALAGLWAAFATALCQGLGWFKRLALIGVMTMLLRLAFGGLVTMKIPTAEMVVLASVVGLLANLILLYWKKDLARPSSHPESPWNREFIQFLAVSAACVIGSYCFMQGDQLAAKRYFSKPDLDAYSAASLLARALPMTVGPLLTVLFTHRSGTNRHDSMTEQLKLLALYAAGLVGGAAGLLLLRNLCLKLMARNNPETAEMLVPLTVTMVFVGLLQALSLWSLASRWMKISLLYGGLGVAYWIALLCVGTSPATLLHAMPIVSGLALGALLLFWLATMRRQKSVAPV